MKRSAKNLNLKKPREQNLEIIFLFTSLFDKIDTYNADNYEISVSKGFILMDITPLVSIFHREITEIDFIKVCIIDTQLINLIVKIFRILKFWLN